jgi:Lon protease-like protein
LSAGRAEIAIFPLNAVLFPGGLLPLRIFEQRYMDMAKGCLRDDVPFGVCLIRSGNEVGTPATPEPVGCTAKIVEWDMQQLGVLSVTALGGQRFRILDSRVTETGLTRAGVEMLPEDADSKVAGGLDACASVLKAVIKEHGTEIMAEPYLFDSSSWVSSRLTEILPVPLAAKQKLLELEDAAQRIEILNKFLLQHRIAG